VQGLAETGKSCMRIELLLLWLTSKVYALVCSVQLDRVYSRPHLKVHLDTATTRAGCLRLAAAGWPMAASGAA
jgi:hypothetical protein